MPVPSLLCGGQMTKHKKGGCLDTPDGFMTYREAAVFYDLSHNTIAMRKHLGWSDHKTVLTRPRQAKPIYITVEGVQRKLTDFVRANTHEYELAKARISRGVNSADALLPPGQLPKTSRYIRVHSTAYGRLSVEELSRILDIPVSTLKTRRKLMWIDDEIFNTPQYLKRGTSHIMPPKEYQRKKEAHEKAWLQQRNRETYSKSR